MSTMFKYRVHEVAKDFKVPTKTVTEILTEYATTPKNHMQALTEEELDLVFEYFTQHNQMDSIEELFAADTAKAAEKKEAKGDKSTAAVGKSCLLYTSSRGGRVPRGTPSRARPALPPSTGQSPWGFP